jgi:hypothetical protein
VLDGGKSGLEELAAELAEHVGDGGLGAVPGAYLAAPADVTGVVAGAGVPGDQQGLDQEPEWDGALDGFLSPVAGVPDAQDLLAGAFAGSIGHRQEYRSAMAAAPAAVSVVYRPRS